MGPGNGPPRGVTREQGPELAEDMSREGTGGQLQPVLMRHTPQLSIKTRGGGVWPGVGGGGGGSGRESGGGSGRESGGGPAGGRGGSYQGSGGGVLPGVGGGSGRGSGGRRMG